MACVRRAYCVQNCLRSISSVYGWTAPKAFQFPFNQGFKIGMDRNFHSKQPLPQEARRAAPAKAGVRFVQKKRCKAMPSGNGTRSSAGRPAPVRSLYLKRTVVWYQVSANDVAVLRVLPVGTAASASVGTLFLQWYIDYSRGGDAITAHLFLWAAAIFYVYAIATSVWYCRSLSQIKAAHSRQPSRRRLKRKGLVHPD